MHSAYKTHFLIPLTLTVILIWTSNCNAQNNWAVIATPGSPDTVSTFDLANPGGTLNELGNVATNFNRGMDYFAADSFYYYVSTDTLNEPGDRGLWSWVNGVNTQIASVEFSDATNGDATWDEATSRFYVVVDDQDDTVGDSLYVWENIDSSPTFTEIGETGVSAFIGLAIDPSDGTLYGYDSLDDILYTIDTTTGAVTEVGESGVAVSTVGGMDFNADGSTLVCTASTVVYTVDKSTGAFTEVGNTGLNTTTVAFIVAEATPTDSDIPPTMVETFRGVEVDGPELSDFVESDDVVASYNPGFTIGPFEAPVWLIFDANDAAATGIRVESSAGTPGLEYTVEAFNWAANGYDVLATQVELFNNDQVVDFAITPADHVDTNGDIRTRLGWRRVGFTITFPWQVNVDQVVWTQ